MGIATTSRGLIRRRMAGRKIEQARNFLVTGVPGVGKTTLVRRLCEQLTTFHPIGFYTEEIREGGIRKGFALASLDGKRGVLSHVNAKSSYRVGKYGVDVKAFEAFLDSLHLKDPTGLLIFIDEIGKMECFSAKFVGLVKELLGGPGLFVATVALKGPGFISEVKKREDVVLFDVTERNRNNLVEKLGMQLEGVLLGVQGRRLQTE